MRGTHYRSGTDMNPQFLAARPVTSGDAMKLVTRFQSAFSRSLCEISIQADFLKAPELSARC